MNTLEQAQDDKETQLQALLLKLPKELRVTWESRSDELPIDQAIMLIEKVLTDRTIAKEKIFTTIHDIEDPTLKEEVKSAIKMVEGSFRDANLFVGNGSVGEVYHLPDAPHVCVKYLVNPDQAREHGNNFREEVQYLNDMHGFSVDGIRAPDVLFYHMSDFGTCFGMEKIDGHSLNIITENPERIEYLDIIRKQDASDVIRRMKNFVAKMHSEKKIVHRDLTDRNIMVDRNGNWYVIDFGRAKRIEIGDNSTDMSEASDAPSAEGAIRALFAKIA